MGKSVVFFDLDGTLLQDDKNVAPATQRTLQQLAANGNEPVLATGRDLWEIRTLMQATGIHNAVAGNGATIVAHDNIIQRHYIASRLVTAISQQCAHDGLVVAWYNEDGAVLSGLDDLSRGNYQDVHQVLPPVHPDFYQHAHATRMLIFVPNDARGQAITTQYAQQFPELSFYHDSPFDIDLIETRWSKASGIKTLLASPEFAGATTFAFGDGDNDIPMTRVVDYSVAMANASPEFKAASNFTTRSNMAGGIEFGLQHYNLI
jgi:Cof subfamily protein (haloacid dehalogenase superfamily)